MAHTLSRKLLAEALGTLLLLATIVGSGIMADALASEDGDALLPHALAIGAMLFVLITLFGPVSGAHFNPAVTMIFTLRGDLPVREAAPYIVVQVIAAIAGVLLAHLMFDLDLIQISGKPRSSVGQWVAELVATAGLLIVILGGLKTQPTLIPVMVGAYIMAGLWFTASTSFANPAVTVARMLSDTFTGIDPSHVPMFVISQIVGALLGWQLSNIVWGR